jgi:starvation-inducible DNA-binding protein
VATSADPPNSPLPDDVCEKIGRHLQLTLVELIALSLAGKQLQWNAYGREFLSLHRHLGRLVGEWRELEDAVAERAAAIGIASDGSAAAVIELGDLARVEPEFVDAERAGETLCARLWEVTVRVRRRAERLGAQDLVSQHVLVDVVRRLEAQLWMLRAQLSD